MPTGVDREPYVTNRAWVRLRARPDAIDEIADAFERPATVPGGARTAPFADASADVDELMPHEVPAAGWPRRSRGWRTTARMHPAASLREPA